MSQSIKQRLGALSISRDARVLSFLFGVIYDSLTWLASAIAGIVKMRTAMINMCLTDAGTAIATTKTKIKTAATATFLVNGVFYSKGATDNLWTLTGFNCTNALYNKCLLCLDTSGNPQIAAGTAAAAAASVVLPTIPSSYAVVGMVQVHPTGTGNFTGGTTDLDDGTVVPNAVYTDLAFHPDTFSIPSGSITLNE